MRQLQSPASPSGAGSGDRRGVRRDVFPQVLTKNSGTACEPCIHSSACGSQSRLPVGKRVPNLDHIQLGHPEQLRDSGGDLKSVTRRSIYSLNIHSRGWASRPGAFALRIERLDQRDQGFPGHDETSQVIMRFIVRTNQDLPVGKRPPGHLPRYDVIHHPQELVPPRRPAHHVEARTRKRPLGPAILPCRKCHQTLYYCLILYWYLIPCSMSSSRHSSRLAQTPLRVY